MRGPRKFCQRRSNFYNVFFFFIYFFKFNRALKTRIIDNCIGLINIAYLTACAFIRSSWRCTFWMTSTLNRNEKSMSGSRGGGGGRGPDSTRKTTKIWGFLAILVRISREITKLPSQHSMLGHLNVVSLVGRWLPAYSVSTHQLNDEKTFVEVGHPQTKLSGSAYEIDTCIIRVNQPVTW